MNSSIETSVNSPPKMIAKHDNTDAMSTFSCHSENTEGSLDMLANLQKKYPHLEQKDRTINPRARFFQGIKIRANNRIRLLQNRKDITPGPTIGRSDSTAEAAEEGSVASSETPDFYEDEGNSYTGYSGNDASYSDDGSMSLSNLKPSTDIEDRENTGQHFSSSVPGLNERSKTASKSTKLQVGFTNRNRRRLHLGNSPVGKAFFNVKNRVLSSKNQTQNGSAMGKFRHWSMHRMHKWSSKQLEDTKPPSWKEYRALEKQLMQTKLEFAMLQTDLDYTKGRLSRTTEERDWLQKQYSAIQHEHSESRDTLNEYKMMIHHLKNHAQEASLERKTTFDIEEKLTKSSNVLRGALSIRGGPKGRFNRSWTAAPKRRVSENPIVDEDGSL